MEKDACLPEQIPSLLVVQNQEPKQGAQGGVEWGVSVPSNNYSARISCLKVIIQRE